MAHDVLLPCGWERAHFYFVVCIELHAAMRFLHDADWLRAVRQSRAAHDRLAGSDRLRLRGPNVDGWLWQLKGAARERRGMMSVAQLLVQEEM